MIYRQIGVNTRKLELVEHNFNTPLEALANTHLNTIDKDVDFESYKKKKLLIF